MISCYKYQIQCLLFAIFLQCSVLSFTHPVPPAISPATGLPNQLYEWKEHQQIRYQQAGPEHGEPIILVHGLFVNSDHWRKTLKALGDEGYHAFALDLWGCGYSDKPPSHSAVAQAVNGENGRFDESHPSILRHVELGTAGGVKTRIVDVELKHPLGSPYNFYTWSSLVSDFCKDIVLKDDTEHSSATLVCNSIGTITALQAVLDTPDLYKGVFVISPNFRELHSAEVPISTVTMVVIRAVQSLLRRYGQVAFDALAKPDTVRSILEVPYAVRSEVDDTLVQVLLDPLLTEGASKVVFDTLSYSAGPLPENQLATFPKDKPVWIGYGEADPWTPGARVRALQKYPAVECVQSWPGVGHCPHDEAPEQVHPLLFQFLDRLKTGQLKDVDPSGASSLAAATD
jgi:pimeloyl-ACP methyl ester carboxylesterase